MKSTPFRLVPGWLWKELKPDPETERIQRNVAITQPILWIQE